MSVLAISEAAERLGVSTRQVQHLVAQGQLRQSARGIVDRASVERLHAVRGGSHSRGWAEATAWGAVSLLSGSDAEWMGETQRSRLRSRLRGLSAAGLVERSRERAVVTRYVAHSSTWRYLRPKLVHAPEASQRLGLVWTAEVDGYLPAHGVEAIVDEHGLRRDDEGQTTLRATTMDLKVVRDLADRSVVLTALDLAESFDVRQHRAGMGALDRALADFRS